MSTPIQIYSLNLGMARAYLVENSKRLILVDAGSPGQEKRVLNYIQKLGRTDLSLIFITHAHLDHYGSAAAIRRATGAPIAVHQLDAAIMENGETPLGTVRGRGKIIKRLLPVFMPFFGLEPTRPDLILNDGCDLSDADMQIKVIHTPGHTHGSSCLCVDGRIVFAGDLISTNGKAHTQRYYAHDWSQIHKSLTRLKSLSPELVYPGHGRHALTLTELLSLTSS